MKDCHVQLRSKPDGHFVRVETAKLGKFQRDCKDVEDVTATAVRIGVPHGWCELLPKTGGVFLWCDIELAELMTFKLVP